MGVLDVRLCLEKCWLQGRPLLPIAFNQRKFPAQNIRRFVARLEQFQSLS